MNPGVEQRTRADDDVTLEQEFVLRTRSNVEALGRSINSNWRAFLERDTPLRVIVTSKDIDRLEGSIRYYFGVLLKAIAEQVVMAGHRHDREIWDYHFRKKHLPYTIRTNPITGEQYVVVQELKRGKIGAKRMRDFILEVESEATQDLGVMLPARPDEF